MRCFLIYWFPVSDGLGGGVLNGSQWFPFTVNPTNQHRSFSQTFFLQQSLANSGLNLNFYQLTQAMNIPLNGKRTATGVNVSGAGMSYKPNARRELMLRAGAVCSQGSYCL
jgi:choline dehydrogenase